MSCNHCCGGSPSPNTNHTSDTPISDSEMYQSLYHIAHMDCSAEEQMVRMVLSDISQIKHLHFNLPQRQLTVWHKQAHCDEITKKLDTLNYQTKWIHTQKQLAPNIDTQQHLLNQSEQRRVLSILLAINATLFMSEFIVGWWAKSSGLLGDALDMLADALVYGIALYAVGKSIQMQKNASKIAGITQLILASLLFIDIIRKLIYGAEPISILMITMSIIALVGNVICLYLIAQRQNDGIHMKASYIFSANDVLINLGVIIAGSLVWYYQSPLPDLIIGTLIVLIVANGARKILFLK